MMHHSFLAIEYVLRTFYLLAMVLWPKTEQKNVLNLKLMEKRKVFNLRRGH